MPGLLDYGIIGGSLGIHGMAFPLADAVSAGRLSLRQHRNDGLPKALAYAAGASLGQLGRSVIMSPGVNLGHIRDLYTFASQGNSGLVPGAAMFGSYALGAALTLGAYRTFGRGLGALRRGRWLPAALYLGIGGASLYSAAAFAGRMDIGRLRALGEALRRGRADNQQQP